LRARVHADGISAATMMSGYANVTKLSFQYAAYGTDTPTFLGVYISLDGTTWVEIMAPTAPTTALQLVELVIDYEDPDIVSAGITASSNVRFKFGFTGTAGKRVNLDQVQIFGLES
ncbi:MAG: hypothetical protein PHI01_00215, partial [Candidatus Izemoplasmatales bacterium]|nr:hypothetical protein [Candidatus Izemoplasmatales bacterium]